MTITDQPISIAQSSPQAVRKAANAVEASFLSEMLKHAGSGKTPSAFGGGREESQFASFLRDAQAEHIVAAGGIGLSDAIFRSLMEKANG